MNKEERRLADKKYIKNLIISIEKNKGIFIKELTDILELYALVNLYREEYFIDDVMDLKVIENLIREAVSILQEYTLSIFFDENKKFFNFCA